jgi:hypothetical protein
LHRYAAALLFALMALLLAASGANAAAPALTITPSYFGNAGTNGWYVGPVTVNWDIEPKDPGNTSSGCDGVKIAVETTGTTVTCTAWNADGAKFQTTTKLIKIDMTPPAASLAPSRGPDSGGWYNHSVSVSFAGNDAISGVDSCSAVKSYSGPDSESAVISGSCTDRAGNVGSVSFAFKYDSTAPSVTAVPARGPDANGWYNHAIAVAFSGADGTSGIASCSSASYSGPDNPTTALAGSCTDKAGNATGASFPLKYDSTPPKLLKLAATAGNRRLVLSWVASPDTQLIHVMRTSSARGVKVGLVYSGTGARFRDTRLKVGARYQYTVTAIDQAGNSVSKTLAVTATGALLAPTPAQTVSRPPLLRWTPVKGAAYYNVQLVRGKKILSAWPATNHFRVPRSWIFEGHRYRLHRGVYRWYIWPGFGTFSSNRYGSVLGGSSFVFSPG